MRYFNKPERMAWGIEYYKSMMTSSFPDQVTMEKSPRYWISSDVPENVKRLNPKIKLILSVREPACRVGSDFHYRRVLHDVKDINFDEFVSSNHERLNFYLTPSFYDIHLENWLKSFPLKQIFIIRNEDMLIGEKLAQILRDLENFLEIPHEFNVKTTNDTTCVTSPYQEYMREPRRSLCIPDFSQMNGTCSYEGDYKETIDSLRTMFKPHVERFEVLAQRKFNWY